MNEKQIKFIEMHEKFVKGAHWLAERPRGAGEKARYRILEREIDRLWAAMPEKEAEEVWRHLVAKGELPEKMPEVVDLFDGKVVSLNAK